MKVLITKKEVCEHCFNGQYKRPMGRTITGIFSWDDHFRWEDCQYCNGTGFISHDEVVEVDKDLRDK